MNSKRIVLSESLSFDDVVQVLDTTRDELWDLVNREQLISFLVKSLDQQIAENADISADRRSRIILNVKNVIVDELEHSHSPRPNMSSVPARAPRR